MLYTGNGPGPEEIENVSASERLAVRQAQEIVCLGTKSRLGPGRHRVGLAALGAVRTAVLTRIGVRAKTDLTVSLNCRTLAKPAANAHVGYREIGRLKSSRAVWARWALASASAPVPTSAINTRCNCLLAVAEATCEARDTLGVDRPEKDQLDRPRRHVGPAEPFRRAGSRIGPASHAGAEACLLCRSRVQ